MTEVPEGIGRRALLVSGLAGAGVGAAGGYAFANRNPKPVPSGGRLEYGPAPSGGDDTSTLQDALDALPRGGQLMLPSGSYRVGGPLVVPAGVHIVGSGGFPMSPAAGTALTCMRPDAGLWFRGGSNGARDLAVIGNAGSSAGAPLVLVGGADARDVGADCFFMNVSVTNAPGDGWAVRGVQNSTFLNCRVQASQGDGLALDDSAGGHLFQRFESAGNHGYNLHVRQSRRAVPGAYPVPADNTFVACIFEQRMTAGSSVLLEELDATSFVHCAFAATAREAAGDATALVEIRAGVVEFVSPVSFVPGASRSAFGVHGAGQPRPPKVAVSGLAQVAGGPASFADVDASATLLLDATVLGLHDDTPNVATTLLSATTPAASVYSKRQAALVIDRDVSAARHLSPPVTTTLSTGGPLHLDAAAGDRQVVQLAGHAVTGLSIRNAADGQRLTLIFIQGVAPARLALPGSAGGFRWSGGDAHIPTVTSAHGYLAVELIPVAGGAWLELSRAGTNVR